jgi:Rieske Fe-S protein
MDTHDSAQQDVAVPDAVTPSGTRPPGTTRRTVLVAAGALGVVAALAGCEAYGDTGAQTEVAQGTGAPTDAGATPGAGGAGSGGGTVLGPVSGIPVGGGQVFGDQQVVVTQPQAGTIKAFTAVCTHQGCTVANVTGGTINCTCHGSKFDINTGAVVNPPAPRPLKAVTVTVAEGQILLP